MPTVPFIVGLGGTTRPGSTSERALQVALDRAAAQGCETLLLGGSQLPADIFDPTRSERSDAARRLVDALRRADGLLIAQRHRVGKYDQTDADAQGAAA